MTPPSASSKEAEHSHVLSCLQLVWQQAVRLRSIRSECYLKQFRPEKQTMRKMTKMMMMTRAARASFIFMFCHHIFDRSWRPVC